MKQKLALLWKTPGERKDPVIYFKSFLIFSLFWGLIFCLPVSAANVGERADWNVVWSHITTWPYGSEHFAAAERFKNGDQRIVFAGVNQHVAIYNPSTNTWQAIGYWPYKYYDIHDVTVRDGNASIVFVGEYGSYAVLEFVSGRWQWIVSGVWPAGWRYKYHDEWHSIDIWTVCDRYGSDNTVVMGGDGGYYALLDSNNVFLTNSGTRWKYSGSYDNARICATIPYADGKIRLVGRDDDTYGSLAMQWLNADNTLGTHDSGQLSGIKRGAKKGSSSYWWLSDNGVLGADNVQSEMIYIGFIGPMQEWANGTLFIGEYSGGKRYKIWRYDGTFGKEGFAPTNIGWVETQLDGSILIAGDGKIYRGISQPAPNVEQPNLMEYPSIKIPQVTVEGRPTGKWNLGAPVQQNLYSWAVPDGGTMHSLVLQYDMSNISSGGRINDGGFCRIRIRGYKAGTGPGGIQEVLVAEVSHYLDERESESGSLAVLFPQGITFFKVTCEPEVGRIDENPCFVINITLNDLQYYTYCLNNINVQWHDGYVLSWQTPAYSNKTDLEYALTKNGSQLTEWSSNKTYTDTDAKGEGAEKYSVLCRYKGSSTYKEFPIAEEKLQTAWNTAAIKEIKNTTGSCWILKVSGVNGATCTHSNSFAVTIAALGATEFRARADTEPWSEWVPIGSAVLVTGLTKTGAHTIYVEARNSSGVTVVDQMTVFRI